MSTIGMTDKYRECIKFVNENCSHFPFLMNYQYFCYIKLVSCSVNLVTVSLKLILWHTSSCLLLVLMKWTQNKLDFAKAARISKETEELTGIQKSSNTHSWFCVTISMHFSVFRLIQNTQFTLSLTYSMHIQRHKL